MVYHPLTCGDCFRCTTWCTTPGVPGVPVVYHALTCEGVHGVPPGVPPSGGYGDTGGGDSRSPPRCTTQVYQGTENKIKEGTRDMQRISRHSSRRGTEYYYGPGGVRSGELCTRCLHSKEIHAVAGCERCTCRMSDGSCPADRPMGWGTKYQAPALRASRRLPSLDRDTQRVVQMLRSLDDQQPERSRSIPARIRRSVIERDGLICQICYCSVRRVKENLPDQLTLDHVFPWSLGGEHTVSNLRVACRACNTKKNAQITEGAMSEQLQQRGRA